MHNVLKMNNRLSQATEYTKIKIHLDNMIATFGEDIVKAVIMGDLSLKEHKPKAVKEQKTSIGGF
jgi:hypothetical protein